MYSQEPGTTPNKTVIKVPDEHMTSILAIIKSKDPFGQPQGDGGRSWEAALCDMVVAFPQYKGKFRDGETVRTRNRIRALCCRVPHEWMSCQYHSPNRSFA